LANVAAAKAVADIIRTTLAPQSMLKMILDPMGGIVLTNDGNAILREIDVSHPAAKSMIELSRTQDEVLGILSNAFQPRFLMRFVNVGGWRRNHIRDH
jgi:T-complex protein 1 subunit gamma